MDVVYPTTCRGGSVSSLITSGSLVYYSELYDFTASVALPVCTAVASKLPGGPWAQSCAPLGVYTLGKAGGRGSSLTLTALCSNGVRPVVSSINSSMCAPGSGLGIYNGLFTWWVMY